MLEAGHPDEEVLEQYSMQALDGPALEEVEDHLMLCNNCQERVLVLDSFVHGMRAALAHPVPEKARTWNILDYFKMPVPVWAAGAVAAAGLAGIFITHSMTPGNAPLAIALSATRGTTTPVAKVSGGLDLDLDTRDLAAGSCRVQLVNADGVEIWSAPAVAQNGHAHAVVNKRLTPGQYYVRIADPVGARREFGLRLGN